MRVYVCESCVRAYKDRLRLGGSEELRQVYTLRFYRAKELPISFTLEPVRKRFLGITLLCIYMHSFTMQ